MLAAAPLAELRAALPSLDGDGWLRPFRERERYAEAHGEHGALDARRARAAAQVARFAARTAPDGHQLPGLRWHVEQARRLVRDLRADDAEAALLAGVVQAGALVTGRASMLPLAALAYAHHVARETRWEEALVFLAIAVRSAGAGMPARDATAAAMLAGRARAALRDWELAATAYALAEAAALAAGDGMSAARATLGLAECAQRRGDLRAAETLTVRLLASARGTALADVRADALLLLGDVLATLGRPVESLDATYRALAHVAGEAQMVRSLAALGRGLAACGAHEPARTAWRLVRDAEGPDVQRADALRALLHLDALVGDRLAFERSRRDLAPLLPTLPALLRTELLHLVGLGHARFGRLAAAAASLEEALASARAADLLQWQAAIARTLAELPTLEGRLAATPAPLPPLVARVAHGLAALAAARSA